MIIINTGNGKGKTTAAFGQALRASGQNLRVVIIQFIKGAWQTGETKAVHRNLPHIEIHISGTGFTWEAENKQEVIEAGREGWNLARGKILSGKYDLVVLDELTYLIQYGIISEAEVLGVLAERPPGTHIVITGRDAPPGLIAVADLVTEMREIKHPFAQGTKGCQGIEF